MENTEKLLTTKELIKKLKMGETHVRALIRAGKLKPSLISGKTKLFRWEDVLEQMKTKETYHREG